MGGNGSPRLSRAKSYLTDFHQDAGIAYKDIRVTFDEYPDFKKGKLQEMNPLATVPVVEVGGRFLTQTYAMVRHFARQLGAYDGNTEEEKYWADAMCDVALDCRCTMTSCTFAYHFWCCRQADSTFAQGAANSPMPSWDPIPTKITPSIRRRRVAAS